MLDQPAADAHGRAVQWRQLVELVARGGGVSPRLRDQALKRIATLCEWISSELLEATARAIAGPTVPVELIAMFAARGATQSAALLAGADLSAKEWDAVRSVAADDVLPLLATLAPASTPQPHDDPENAEAPYPANDVRAAETFEPGPSSSVAPVIDKAVALLPTGMFHWGSGPNGEIDWVEGAPRAALVGRSLAESFSSSFAARLPFADEPLVLAEEGAMAGEWRWSGTPAFFADSGRFAGYRGIARRDGPLDAASVGVNPEPTPGEDDGLRELMHELRTPLNAIIGFGEIIEGQYLGPAHRGYRERAAEIVRQARNLADAVDNLDLAARLRSGRVKGEATSGLDAVKSVLHRCTEEAAERQLRLTVDDRAGAMVLAMPPELAGRIVRQFTVAMLEPATAGEPIRMVVDRSGKHLAIAVDRATALRGLTEQQVLADRGRAGMRFALRLVQGLAAMTGGRLDFTADRLILLLPLAD